MKPLIPKNESKRTKAIKTETEIESSRVDALSQNAASVQLEEKMVN